MSGKYQMLIQLEPGDLRLFDIDEKLVPGLLEGGFSLAFFKPSTGSTNKIKTAPDLDTSTKAVEDLVRGWEVSDADSAIEVASAIKHLRALCIERDSLKQECERSRKLMILGVK